MSTKPEVIELHLDDDFGWDDGLLCGGTARILLEPGNASTINASMMQPILETALETMARKERIVLATIVSSPQPELEYVRCLCHPHREIMGLSPNLPLSKALCLEAEKLLSQGSEMGAQTISVSVDDGTQAYTYEVYFEPILPRPTLLITGAGHIGAALAHLAALLEFEVVVVDDRSFFANQDRFPEADKVIVADIAETVADFAITPETYIVIVTRGHRHDAAVLRACINSNARYIGMIGSRRKIKLIYDELLAEKLTSPERLSQVYSPIGLDIGSVSVWEIAMSIAAELAWVRQGKKGSCQSLRQLAKNKPGESQASFEERKG